LYAFVQPGLEPIAADEITRDLQGEVKRTSRGVVVFRLNEITADILKLRTTEDLYLLAWGSDSLTYRATDLATIKTWTSRKVDWQHLFRIHHALRPKTKGKPTFHLVCQMQGEHGYRRIDALDALADGLAGKIPIAWQPAEENAWLEIWLTITGKTAVCGLRLTDRTMRHRTYKTEHVAASLRPTVAAAMTRLAGIAPGQTVLDPMCGAGTILCEIIQLANQRRYRDLRMLGGDIDPNAVFCTKENLASVGQAELVRWDSTALPLTRHCVDRIVCNPPFGKQLSNPEKIPELYFGLAREWDRVLKPGGRAVILVSEMDALREAIRPHGWQPQRQIKVRVLGQPAVVSVWQKADEIGTIP
jgi:23S rRNA G2445 N2-methylase RlmL